MAKNITTSVATDIAAYAHGILIVINADLTGTVITSVGGSTQYGTSSATIGTITNPRLGQSFRYLGLDQQGKVTVTTNASCDITVSVLGRGDG